MEAEHRIPIWFFIGAVLAIYGAIILGAGLFHLAVPVPENEQVKLYHLHADIWWGALLLCFGAFYCWRFRPDRAEEAE